MTFKPAIALTLLALGLSFSGSAQAAAPEARTTVAATESAAPVIAVPPAEYLVSMTRSALAALNHANLTGNYSVLHQLGASGFQQANPAQRLGVTFQSFRENRIDLTPTAVLAPQFTVAPFVRDQKLRLIGRFPSQPMQVNFDLTFTPEGGHWRLFGLAVNLNPSAKP